MTPIQAIKAQIKKNEQILSVVRTNAVPGITPEGRAHKEKELIELNAGLREALVLLHQFGDTA